MLSRNIIITGGFVIAIVLLLAGMKQLTSENRIYENQKVTATKRAHEFIQIVKMSPIDTRDGHLATAYLNTIPICDPCSNIEQGKVDVLNWQLENSLALPSGRGHVGFDGTNYIISLYWQGKTGDPRCGMDGYRCLSVKYKP